MCVCHFATLVLCVRNTRVIFYNAAYFECSRAAVCTMPSKLFAEKRWTNGVM